MQFLKCILFLVILNNSVLAGTTLPSKPDQAYLDYAKKGFECVVPISGLYSSEEDKEKNHKFQASAVVISPHYFLTAAHVVKDAQQIEIKIKDKIIKSNKVFINENYENDKFGFHDIAIGYCEEKIEIDFYPELYKEKDEENKIVSICGYGIHGNFSTGAVKSDGLKRAGSNKIARCERNVLVCVLNDQNTELEFLISTGDSGGGLFIGNKLAGINTFVMTDDGRPNSDYGDECAHTRISLYTDWIEKILKENEQKP
jgi:hypothetical protein